MTDFVRDVRFSIRSLRRSPGLAVAALLALGLGVGATAAIYTVVDAVLLEPLPYPQPDELVLLIDGNPEAGFPRFSSSPPNYADWKQQATSFEAMGAYSRANLVLDAPGADPERISGAVVTDGFFQVLGKEPLYGRTFTPQEDLPGGEAVAVLGNGLWRRRFGGDPGIVGRTVTIDGEARRVVGVMPEGFQLPREVELWLPMALEIDPQQRGAHYIAVLARLRGGVDLAAAQAEMTGIAKRLEEAYPGANAGWTVNLHRVHELMVEDIRPVLRVLGAAVLAVLLVRAARREREMAVRTALGAGRGRLAAQLLTETLLLALGGGALGLAFGVWGTRALVAMNADDIPRPAEIGLDSSVFLFTLGVALVAGLLAGLAPVVHSARADLQGSLKEGTSGTGEGSRARLLRRGLVLTEVALAVVLLVAAGLLIRSLLEMASISPGFEAKGVLTAQVSLPEASYPGDPELDSFYRRLGERLAAIPGVESAGAGFPLPLSGGNYFLSYYVEGRPEPPPQETPSAGIRFVTPGYLETLEVPLLAGRRLTEADRQGSRPVALVDRLMAERTWPGESPLGARITFSGADAEEDQWMEVVGVVGDVRHAELGSDPGPQIYLPMGQSPMDTATLVLRTSTDPEALTGAVRSAVREIDPSLPLYRVQPMEDVVAASLADQRFSATLLGVFAALALVLASLGVYGVISYSVAQRSRELGLRMALGARRDGVLRLVVRQGMGLVLVGVGVGLVGAFLASRLLRSLLYEVGAGDPLTYVVVPVVLTLVGLVATLIPALRATRVDPVVALKAE
jgi:predicted permease